MRQAICDAGGPTRRFWILLVLSTVIAGYGLLANSAAVIIGAMIIAPLMGPIAASAYALDAGDNRLLVRALTAEILGVTLAILIGWLIGLGPIQLGVSTEMLARTTPTLYDLLIATASGLAGAYAMVDSRVSGALAGVAISVALVPPLATCGLFLAFREFGNAWGAFLLFFANFLAIQIAAGVVFFAYGVAEFQELRNRTRPDRIVRFIPSLILLLGVGAFMTSTLMTLAKDRSFQQKLNATLSREIGARTGGQFDRILQQGPTENGYQVVAVALTPQPFDPLQVATIENVLRQQCRPDIHLVIRSLSSFDADRDGQVFLSQAEIGAMAAQKKDEVLLKDATAAVKEHLKDIPGATLVNIFKTQSTEATRFTAIVRTPVAVSPDQVALIQAALAEALGKRAFLTVRSVITRDADATRYLYETVKPDTTLTAAQSALRQRLQEALGSRIRDIPGAELKEVKLERTPTETIVTAVVESPELVRPDQVKQYQSDLRAYVDPTITLAVRTTLVGTAEVGGWARAAPHGQ